MSWPTSSALLTTDKSRFFAQPRSIIVSYLLIGISFYFAMLSLDPELIYDKAQTKEEGFDGALEIFPKSFNLKQIQPELSGEFCQLVP